MPPWVSVILKYTGHALNEFKYLAALSLMPIWLGALLQFVTDSSILAYLNGYLENGEGLLLCSATVGPLIYVIIKDDEETSKNSRPFPGKFNYILSIIVICIISAAILGLRTAIKSNPYSIVSMDAVWMLSAIVSSASLIIWFLVTGTRAAREHGAPSIMRASSMSFLKQFQAHHDE